MKHLIEGLIVLLAVVQAGAEVQIEGRVRLDSGEPVAGAQVLLFELADLRSTPVGTTTDQTGYFALPLRSLQGRASVSPERFDLGQNYPNPFNPSTIIPYQLSAATQVRLDVFNLLGQRIATLVAREQPAGFHTARWSATDAAGHAVGAGVYFYRLTADGEHLTRRMVLIDGQVGVPVGTALGGSRVAEAVQAAPVYGLTVSGPGLVPYVDPSFRVESGGRGPVDLEVEVLARVPLAKVASGGLLGDVDNNGRVDVFDALLVAIYSVNTATVMPNNGKISLGDVNQDGQTDITDAWLIATYTVDPFNPELPVGIGKPVALALDGGDSRQTVETFDFSSMPAANRWNLPEGALARLGKGTVRDIIFSANGARMAVSSYIGTWLYDTYTGAEVALIPRTKRYASNSIAVSSDGSTLAIGSFQMVRVWDAASGQLKILDGRVSSVALSPDGATLASAIYDTVKLWDIASGQLKILKEHRHRVGSMVFSPDGTVLASGSEGGGVRLWDAASGQPKAALNGAGIYGVSLRAFSPDGATLASAIYDTVKLWDIASGQLKILKEHRHRINSLAFSPDGSTLASSSEDGTVGLWDVANGLFKILGEYADNSSLAFSPDGSTLASGSPDGIVRLWDVASGQLKTTLDGHRHRITSMVFSPDGSTLASASEDGTAGLWDVANGLFKAILEEDIRGVYSLSFSPDGSTLASSNGDGTVGLWDMANGLFKILGEYADNNRPLAFSPDGSTLASGFFGMVRLWDPASGQVQGTWPGHTRLVSSVVFSPDCATLASGSWDGTIRLWDMAGSQLKTILENPGGSVFSLAFSPDGSILASGSSETIQLWDVASGQLRTTLEGHTYWVYSVAFSPDGSTLASGSRDGTIRLWDMANGQLKKTLERPGLVFSLAFSPDGSTLASGSKAGTVRLWDMASGQLKKILEGHGNEVYSVSYAPSGTILASASLDGTILLWDATAAAEFSPPSQ